jgi:Zn finger protein HypA/HybF involved in hydrogenase expression
MIRDFPEEQFREVVSESTSISDALRKLGVSPTSAGQRVVFKNRCRDLGIDLSPVLEMALKKSVERLNAVNVQVPLDDLLVENCSYNNRGRIKSRLIQEGILEDRCSECGLEGEWNGKPIKMVLDHINGINDDYRRDNLRLLCPNCNSQTDTFCGRNSSRRFSQRYCECGGPISKKNKTGRCSACANKASAALRKGVGVKVKDRPSEEELSLMKKSMSWVAIGQKYGVSDNAARKWAKQYGLVQ